MISEKGIFVFILEKVIRENTSMLLLKECIKKNSNIKGIKSDWIHEVLLLKASKQNKTKQKTSNFGCIGFISNFAIINTCKMYERMFIHFCFVLFQKKIAYFPHRNGTHDLKDLYYQKKRSPVLRLRPGWVLTSIYP